MPTAPKRKIAGYIDVEPRWEALCVMAQRKILPPEELMPACKLADTLRQAQKAGKKGLIVTFPEGKTGAISFKELK